MCDDLVPFVIDSFVATTGAPLDPAVCNLGVSNEIWNDLWCCFTAAATQLVTIDTCTTDFDTRLAVYANGCAGDDPLAVIACNDDTSLTGCEDGISAVTFPAVAGDSYLIRVGAWNAAGFGTGEIRITEPNVAPIVTGAPVAPIILGADSGVPLALSFTVSAPEPCQSISYSMGDSNGAVAHGLVVDVGPPGPTRTFTRSKSRTRVAWT